MKTKRVYKCLVQRDGLRRSTKLSKHSASHHLTQPPFKKGAAHIIGPDPTGVQQICANGAGAQTIEPECII